MIGAHLTHRAAGLNTEGVEDLSVGDAGRLCRCRDRDGESDEEGDRERDKRAWRHGECTHGTLDAAAERLGRSNSASYRRFHRMSTPSESPSAVRNTLSR